jgi:hypothetical protein
MTGNVLHVAGLHFRPFRVAHAAYLRKDDDDAIESHVSSIDSLVSALAAPVVKYVKIKAAKIDLTSFAIAIRDYMEEFLA